MIAAARQAGVAAIVCIGESRAAAGAARALADANPGHVFFTAGIHPSEANTYDHDLSWIDELVGCGAVAIGECGLDYHYDHAAPKAQREVFRDQIGLARTLGRPLVVHTREAEEDTGAAVRDAAAAGVRGVLHCYTGSAALARTALDAGWSISFSGIVTFTRWTDDALVRLVPDDRLLVETDAPYLAPVPVRGRRNEPRFVRYTLERVAAIRGVTAEHLGACSIANTRTLFGLATAPGG